MNSQRRNLRGSEDAGRERVHACFLSGYYTPGTEELKTGRSCLRGVCGPARTLRNILWESEKPVKRRALQERRSQTSPRSGKDEPRSLR